MLSVSAVLGLAVLVLVAALERALSSYIGVELVPAPADSLFSVGAFPAIAVPVLATVLGFYLATVGIVLGNAYHDVSSAVRHLVLTNRQTRLYLQSVGMSIGIGLAVVLTDNTGIISYGYLVLGTYAFLVCFSGWALARLALRAFNLLNPIVLANEPLADVYRAIKHLDSRGFLLDDAVLRSTALRANRTLSTLAEITRLTNERKSVSRVELAEVIEALLLRVGVYVRKKHRLRPDSGWFIREPSYPRWVESDQGAREIALKTSTSLQPEYSPTSDWLERRSAELVTAALGACVKTDDRDPALQIINAASHTAQILAECSRPDDAINFCKIIGDFIWTLEAQNETADALSAQPPFLMTGTLLGWKDAVLSWPDEIHHVVTTTDWDSPEIEEVQIHGPRRIWQAGQILLDQVRTEHVVEGRRITPDWFLRSTLASEYIHSLREFADTLPATLLPYVDGRPIGNFSPEAQSMVGAQALQMLSKAEFLSETMPVVAEALETLQQGHETDASPEIESLPEKIGDLRASVLIRLGPLLDQLRPEQAKSDPDYFGQTLFTLLYHTEQAISDGNAGIVNGVFPSILSSSCKLYAHAISTYRPPTYELTPAVFAPIIDVLDLSGLAILYETLRDDESAEPVRQAWKDWRDSNGDPEGVAGEILDIVDRTTGTLTPMSTMRMNWGTRLTEKVIECGFAIPTHPPFGDPPVWNAPPLIKMLGVMESSLELLSLDPYVIFAGEVIGPLSGEGNEELRSRRGLQHYYEEKDFHAGPDTPPESGSAEYISGQECKS